MKRVRHDRVDGVLITRTQVFAFTDEQARREAQDKMMAETSEDLWEEVEWTIAENGTSFPSSELKAARDLSGASL